MKPRASLKPALVVAAALLLPLAAAAQQPPAAGNAYAQRFASVCAACHGANGRNDMALTPALAGQHSFYAITQLFLFREGRRSNEAMSAIAKTLTDADLRGFSDYIATLPAVPAPPPAQPADATRMARGQSLAQEHKCFACHGADLSGGQQVPRIAQQREDYLQMALQEFKSGKRPGYTMAMGEAVGRIPVEDLDTLAYFVARFTPAAPARK
ncbi:c-type cytochrome [Pseudorhodoferax soli]|jgi:cytochrome c553|uniref:Cytochrome c553 n=1 Tax=Pseudorhodoferax soli TaxID=545864 RepID=A0A368XRS4_9BURK|nr:c-type cytochrome [Pseudorhodoferax soli]RCW69247.1 cytochrome c553 [Pseudorhodoferax soli]